MTAIAVHEHTLYADRQLMNIGFSTPSVKEQGPKLFTSSDNQFAWSRASTIMQESEREDTEKSIREIIKEGRAGKKRLDKNAITPSWLTNGEHFIPTVIMTRTHIYEILLMGNEYSLREISQFHSGTGGEILMTVLRMGNPPATAFRTTRQLDAQTGSEFDLVRQETLDFFIST